MNNSLPTITELLLTEKEWESRISHPSTHPITGLSVLLYLPLWMFGRIMDWCEVNQTKECYKDLRTLSRQRNPEIKTFAFVAWFWFIFFALMFFIISISLKTSRDWTGYPHVGTRYDREFAP